MNTDGERLGISALVKSYKELYLLDTKINGLQDVYLEEMELH